jgi:hypothetical protein
MVSLYRSEADLSSKKYIPSGFLAQNSRAANARMTIAIELESRKAGFQLILPCAAPRGER